MKGTQQSPSAHPSLMSRESALPSGVLNTPSSEQTPLLSPFFKSNKQPGVYYAAPDAKLLLIFLLLR